MAKDGLMTADDFNRRMEEWGDKVVGQAKVVINSNTHSGAPRFKDNTKNKKLVDTLKSNVRLGDDGIAKWIGFSFIKSGVWLAYGVGRGWVMQNGTLVQGSRVKQGDNMYQQLKKKGYTNRDIGKYVVRNGSRTKSVARNPIDWLDSVIEDNIQEVADINGDFFGDIAILKVLNQFDRMTIKKRYTEIEVR